MESEVNYSCVSGDTPVTSCLVIDSTTGMTSESGDNPPLIMPQPTAWGYWTNWYYPNVILSGYPVYLQERALDKGKQAFEIIKVLKDKKLVKITKVGEFIDLMDELIKIL